MDYFALDSQEQAADQPAPGVRLFLDSADPGDWKRYLPTGVFHGVTTNPLLLERAGQPCTLANLESLTRQACDLGALEIHLQTWGRDPQDMVHHGSQLALMAGLGLEMAVKIPITAPGLTVARQLRDAGCAVTLTAVHNPGQVLLAAGFGAAYAAPYLGRLNDQGRQGRQAVLDMHAILRKTGSATRLLVASLRSAAEVVGLATLGLDTLTFGPAVAAELLQEDLTTAAAADFQRAAEAMSRPT